jgi:hypothetical protein
MLGAVPATPVDPFAKDRNRSPPLPEKADRPTPGAK